jgi:hypothetical protein
LSTDRNDQVCKAPPPGIAQPAAARLVRAQVAQRF